jgi:hypothetical protein
MPDFEILGEEGEQRYSEAPETKTALETETAVETKSISFCPG